VDIKGFGSKKRGLRRIERGGKDREKLGRIENGWEE